MTKEELQILYKKHILAENKDPFNFKKGGDEAVTVQAYNPMCGDKYHLYLGEEEGSFDGFGCAVSKASTSILLRNMDGKSDEEVKVLCEKFLEAFENDEEVDLPEALKVLLELKNFDGRIDCIQLSWKALLDHLNKPMNT